MLVFSVVIINGLDSQSKFQMFTLFFVRHIGVPRRHTNTTFSSGRGGGGGGLPYETDGDASVSRRVFRVKRQYFMPPRSRLDFREETHNYAKRNRSQFFLRFMTVVLKTIFRLKHWMIMSLYH